MRRTILMALLGALLFASPALAQGTRVEILRDCQDDGILQGDYTAAQMRDAKSNMPSELDEYSDCRDVLTRGISAKTSSAQDNNNDDNSGGSGGTGGSGTGGGSNDNTGAGGSNGGSTPSATATPQPDPNSERALPANPQEWAAVHEAEQSGEQLADSLRPVSPGATQLTANVGRNTLPGMLVGVLALIFAAALALVAAPLIRRRGLGSSKT